MVSKKLAEFKAELEEEWYTYVATEVIYIGEARAFNPGDPVPVSHVNRGIVKSSQVVRREDAPPDLEVVVPVRVTPPPGATDMASPEDIAAAEAANRAAGVIE